MKVSVILPSLNVGKYIEECIESVLAQRLLDIEIICIDAGSTDGTWEIINRYKSTRDNVKALQSDKRSYGYQVNMGIRIATGEYVAILETDDFVPDDMYEILYRYASINGLDCIFADFDQFYGRTKATRMYERKSILGGCVNVDWYNRVLCLDENYKVFTNTNYLWSGIYKRDFLIENDITLNETNGAAYQDIGFIHKTMMNARRIMYIDKSLYRYRIDRDGASINSDRGIKNAYTEYKKLCDEGIAYEYQPRFFYTMAYHFLGESYKLSLRTDYDWIKENQEEFYWFRSILLKAIDEKYITSDMLSNGDWELLISLLEDAKEYIYEVRFPGNTADFFESIKNKSVVIFGAGKWGNFFYNKFCNRLEIIAFCDNQEEKHGMTSFGIPIIGIEKLCEIDEEIGVVVSIKKEGMLIRDELINRGFKEDSIFMLNFNGI